MSANEKEIGLIDIFYKNLLAAVPAVLKDICIALECMWCPECLKFSLICSKSILLLSVVKKKTNKQYGLNMN